MTHAKYVWSANNPPVRVIFVEGPDGVGKTTFIQNFMNAFLGNIHEVSISATIRFPENTKEVPYRDLVLSKTPNNLEDTFLFVAGIVAVLREQLDKAKKAGARIMICDRSIMSTSVNQQLSHDTLRRLISVITALDPEIGDIISRSLYLVLWDNPDVIWARLALRNERNSRDPSDRADFDAQYKRYADVVNHSDDPPSPFQNILAISPGYITDNEIMRILLLGGYIEAWDPSMGISRMACLRKVCIRNICNNVRRFFNR